MALEQTINRSKKGTSGIIDITKKKKYVAMCDMIYHEMLAISKFFQRTNWSYNPVPAICKQFLQTETGERNEEFRCKNRPTPFPLKMKQ